MRLYHHYILDTSPTLSRNSRDQYLWQRVVPHQATLHHYVMDSILAVAALHLASTDVENAQSWLHTALDYHDRAITGSRESLVKGDPHANDASAACSLCILIFVTAYPNFSQNRRPDDPLDGILNTRMILKGTRFFVRQLDPAHVHPLLREWLRAEVCDYDAVILPPEYACYIHRDFCCRADVA